MVIKDEGYAGCNDVTVIVYIKRGITPVGFMVQVSTGASFA